MDISHKKTSSDGFAIHRPVSIDADNPIFLANGGASIDSGTRYSPRIGTEP
jgi:hypothetical protein